MLCRMRRALVFSLLVQLSRHAVAAYATGVTPSWDHTTAAAEGLRAAAPTQRDNDVRRLIAQADSAPKHAAQDGGAAGVYRIAVDFNAPSERNVSGMVIVLHYPTDRVSLPGSGADPSVRARVTATPANATVAVNKREELLRVVIARGTPIPAGRLFQVEFDSHPGAHPLVPADFGCTVEGCASAAGDAQGCVCRVVSP